MKLPLFASVMIVAVAAAPASAQDGGLIIPDGYGIKGTQSPTADEPDPDLDWDRVVRLGYEPLPLLEHLNLEQERAAIEREILPAFRAENPGMEFGYLWALKDLDLDGQPEILINYFGYLVCPGRGCPMEVHTFDGLRWNRIFQTQGSEVWTKRDDSRNIAYLFEDGGVAFFRKEGDTFVTSTESEPEK